MFDKVCIHQADAELKAAGISAIGGFIGRSQTLLVAWDELYFSRLWCPFEIAAFRFANPAGRTIILLVEMGKTMAKLSLASLVKACLVEAGIRVCLYKCGKDEDCWRFWLPLVIHLLVLLPYVVLASTQLEHGVALSKLEQQISTYSVRRSECFCCTENHVHPESGVQLSCDRELVFQSTAHWYGGSSESQEQGLDSFDAFV